MQDIECFRCPYCVGYNQYGDFKKILELRDVGLVIYRHTITETVVDPELEYSQEDIASEYISNIPLAAMGPMSDFNNAIIMLNTGNSALTIGDFLPEIENKLISCPRCRFIMEHTKLLLKSIPVINKSDIIGVCNLCKLKQQRSRTTCKVCEGIIRKFSKKKRIDNRNHDESQLGKQKEIVKKRFLSKGKHRGKSSRTQHIEQGIFRPYSEFEMDKTKIDTDQPLPHTKVDYLFSEVEVPKPVHVKKRRTKTRFTENIKITSADQLSISKGFKNKAPMKPIVKISPFIKPSLISPYHSGDMAASLEKDHSTKLRRYHSDETILSALSDAVNDELFKKQFKFFFPHMLTKDRMDSEMMKKKQERIKAETESEENLRLLIEARKIYEKQEQKKKAGRYAADKSIAIKGSKAVQKSKSKDTRVSETPAEDKTMTHGKGRKYEAEYKKEDLSKHKDKTKKIKKTKHKEDSKREEKTDRTKTKDKNIAELKRGKKKREESSLQKSKTDDIIATKHGKILKDQVVTEGNIVKDISNKDKKEIKQKASKLEKLKKGEVAGAETKQKEVAAKKQKLEIGSKEEPLFKVKEDSVKGHKNKVPSITSKKTQTEPQAKQKKTAAEKQKIEVGTKEEPLSKVHKASEKGQKTVPSSTSKEIKTEPKAKQKEATAKEPKVEETNLPSKDTNKVFKDTQIEPLSKPFEKGETLELSSSITKEPQAKQIEFAAKEQKIEVGTKQEHILKEKEVSEKGQKIEIPTSTSKDEVKQKEATEEEQKLEVSSKKEVKEASEREQQKEVPSSTTKAIKKVPLTKQKEVDLKEQKVEDTKHSKDTKKETLSTLNEADAKQEKAKETTTDSKKKKKKPADKQQKQKTKQGVTKEEVNLSRDQLKIKPISTESKKDAQIEDAKKEQNQKEKSQGPVVAIKDIKMDMSQDDLILKLITIRKQEDRGDRTVKSLKAQPLPEVPELPVKKRIILRKKQSPLSLESSLISDKGKATPIDELVFGEVILKNNEVPVKRIKEFQPSLFKSVYTEGKDRTVHEAHDHDVKDMKLEPVEDGAPKGVFRYALSDRKYIENGWTVLPTEKIVRKLNIYRMRPAHPEFDWFKYNKSKGAMQYDSGQKLAEFDDNGRGRWYYRNGRIALDYYDSEDINAQQRIVVYSSGEPDERGHSCPITILGVFDYLGNGVVFDHRGKIRLKYTQDEGVVLDRSIGPTSHWKWHSLNDPPELRQVMMETQMPYPDPTIMHLDEENGKLRKSRVDAEMLNIEFENYAREKLQKTKQTFQPFQIKMKALKINSQFSLRILDQASIYLMYRDGATTLKLNLGMVLDQNEIVDTGMTDLAHVACAVERVPAKSMSVAMLQHNLDRARRCDRAAMERERRVRRPLALASADRLTAPLSRPLHHPLSELPDPTTKDNQEPENCHCNLYHENRLI